MAKEKNTDVGQLRFRKIGVIRTPFKSTDGMPIQPRFSKARGTVILHKKYAKGLKDITGFSHVILIYHFHRSCKTKLHVRPYLDKATRGIFATRSPHRPNKIGISVVKLTGVRGNVFHVQGIDALDGTPLLDIKPYIPPFEKTMKTRIGWLRGKVR